jgi:hypothetical protein
MRFWFQTHRSPEPTEGSPQAVKPFDMNAFLASVLAQNGGDKDASIRQLGRENKKARDSRNRHKARADAAEAKLKTLESPGSKTFAGDVLKEVEEFTGLNLKVKDIKDALAERDSLKAKVTDHERLTASTKASKLLGYKQPTVLLDQLNAPGREQDITFKKEKVDDVEQEVPYVAKRGDSKASAVKMSDYVAENLKAYIPALMSSDEDERAEDEVLTPVPGSGPAPRGKPSTTKDATDKYLAGRYKLPAALGGGSTTPAGTK